MAYKTETVSGIEWEFYTLEKSGKNAKADAKYLETADRFLHLDKYDVAALREEQSFELRKVKPPRGVVGKAAVVTGVAGDVSGDLAIPASLGGYKVTGIGYFAFSGSGLTSVTIPNSVVSIG